MTRNLGLVCLVVAFCPALGAQEAPAPDDWRGADAAIDRHVLASTAQTLRQGEVSLSSYEVVGLGASYGVTDWLQVSLTTAFPAPIPVYWGMLAVKARAWGNRVATLSVQVVLDYAYNSRHTHVLTPALVGLVDLHTPDGLLLWSTSVSVLQPFAFGGGWAGRNTDRPLWGLASGPIVRVHRHVRLLANVMAMGGFGTAHVANNPDDDGLTAEAVVAYGVRFSGPALALDLGFVRYVGDLGWAWVLGFPIGSLTVRF
jgi:hypothetical protein